jgi:hypothetical protein
MKRFLFILFTLLAIPPGCDDTLNLEGMTEQQIQALFVGEWQETDRIDLQHPDRIVGARDTTIVFFPDGRFQGIIVEGLYDENYYSIEGKYLRTRIDATTNYQSLIGYHLYLYSFTKNTLTLDLDSGAIPLPSPTRFIYKRIK